MTDNAVILNGKYVEEKVEQQSYVDNIFTKSEFHMLVEELQKYVAFQPTDLLVKKAYIYDATTVDSKAYGTGKNITLAYEDKVKIRQLVSITKGNRTVEKYYGQVVTEDGQKVLTFDVNKGKVNHLFTDENEGQLNSEVKMTEKHDPEFTPLSTTDEVIAQGVFDFCLTHEDMGVDYNHCGKKCGDGRTATDGGGTPINNIDACCRAHDRCWANFGDWDSCCDKQIVDCTARYEHEDNATQNQIWWVFAASAASC